MHSTSDLTGGSMTLGPRVCSRCGAAAYPADRYCAGCGDQLDSRPSPSDGFCGSCGAEIRHPVAFFCTRCGGSLAGVPRAGERRLRYSRGVREAPAVRLE